MFIAPVSPSIADPPAHADWYLPAMHTAATATRPPFLISIHDVTPAWDAQVRELWSLCANAGVTPALLVVPDWHGAWPLEEHPTFVAWLHERMDEGAELLLHGERHDEQGSPRAWQDSLRALGRTAREGEFLTLDHSAAAARISRGLARLRALDLPVVGFVPPAWLAREATFRAVDEQGLPLSEDARWVRIHGTRPGRISAPVVRWSGRTPLRAWASAAVAGWHDLLRNRRALVRMALHPQDLAHPVTRRSLERTLTRWAAARAAIPYSSLASSRTETPYSSPNVAVDRGSEHERAESVATR